MTIPAVHARPASGRRLRIFALLSNVRLLETTRGDMIGEARFLSSLSRFADVYYNGILFQPDRPGYGLYEQDIQVPQGGYDLYYVRNNHQVFLALPHPKITMAYPYDEAVYRAADAVVVTTEAWKRGLTPYAATNMFSDCMRHWYGAQIVQPRKVINIRQTLNEDFLPEPSPRKVMEAHIRMGMRKTLSFLGRIDSNTFPVIALGSYLRLFKSDPDIRLAIGGTVRIRLNPNVVQLPRLPHDDMPAFLQACRVTLTDEGADARFLGSGKVLDSMARGVPVLAYRTDTRLEQLGEYYPLYYDDAESCHAAMRMALYDDDVWQEARRQLLARQHFFLPATRAAELELELSQMIALCRPPETTTALPEARG
ncbi:MAG: hypothetical protein JJU19_08860 [Pararhodobacter sp.]|nr:hypothetical protein [Pararhodobacter sp.]